MMRSRPQPSLAGRMTLALCCCALVMRADFARAQADSKAATSLSTKTRASGEVDVPKIPYTRFVLPNGLVVLLHENHSAPVVAIDLWYHVGSKDDVPGKGGLAHMYEHMMFEGSVNVARDEYTRVIKEAGGSIGATTSEDRTSYVIPRISSNMLETALWFEADRMAFGATKLDSARFEHERDVVGAEYNQRYASASANIGLGREALVGALYRGTPYEWTQFGVAGELATTTLKDLRDFFSRYTAPNNATLSISGDFKTVEARAMVERYFAPIPRRPAVVHPAIATTALAQPMRMVLEDRNQNNSHLWVGWRGVPAAHPDRLALVALGAVLAGGPTSKLQRALVDGHHLANGLPPGDNGHFDLEEAGVFQLGVFVRPGASMTEVETVVDSVVADVRDNGVQAAELRRWLNTFAVRTVTQLQLNSAKAALLAEGEVYHHNPRALTDDVDAARKLTPADLQRVARKYLVPGRVVLSIVPAGKLDLISKPSEPYINVTKRKSP